MTLVCGTAGFDGTEFKGLLANTYDIQLNKTSRNSVLLQSNITTRQRRRPPDPLLVEICHATRRSSPRPGRRRARPSPAG